MEFYGAHPGLRLLRVLDLSTVSPWLSTNTGHTYNHHIISVNGYVHFDQYMRQTERMSQFGIYYQDRYKFLIRSI